ncbi:MAG: hypothetical protein MUD01_27415 [Chloroflexaceae bacterium]|nr:hypothetical protein [Chloroflexaceae bacterium]
MHSTRIAVIGGSSSSTPELVATLIEGAASLPERLTLALAGRNAQRLELVANLARRMLASAGLPWAVETATEAARAISGSNLVLNQVRVGGMAARDYDESFPLAHGLPGDETAGPGGLANALRSLPAYLATARMIEREAPGATLLQLSNPANPAVALLHKETNLAVVGFCDQPVAAVHSIAQLLGVTAHELDITYGGLNHLGFVLRVRLGGRDVTGDVLERVADAKAFGVEPEVIRALGVIPTPYLRIVYHRDQVLAEQQARPASRGAALLELETRLFKTYAETGLAARPSLLDERGAGRWYRGVLLPLLAALLGAGPTKLVLVTQNGTALPDLPASATVEVSAEADAHGVRALPVGPLPPTMRGLVQAAHAYEELTLRAALEPSESNVLAALLADPLMPNAGTARALVAPVLAGLRFAA